MLEPEQPGGPTATVAIRIPKERYWPENWRRPEQLPQFRSRDTGAMEVLEGGVWEPVPDQAALHIRVLTHQVAVLRENAEAVLLRLRGTVCDACQLIDGALKDESWSDWDQGVRDALSSRQQEIERALVALDRY